MIDDTAIAARMTDAILAGRLKAAPTQIVIDLGDGDIASIFNDCGDPDYTDHVIVAGRRCGYGKDYSISGRDDNDGPLPFDPLHSISTEAAAMLEKVCREAWG